MAGRPSKYDKKINKQVEKLCILGATDAEIADFLDIDVATLNRWKLKHRELCASIKRGKIQADVKVADRLYQRALGYSHKAVKIFNNEGAPMIVPYTEHYPPDTTAAIFWLKNRRGKVNPEEGQQWADKQSIDHTSNGETIQTTVVFSRAREKSGSEADGPATGDSDE